MVRIDKAILTALQHGSHPAFEQVFMLYYEKIKFFLLGFVKTTADAEELAEEIFVELWLNHKNIDPNKSFDSYLYTICRNKAINFLKKKQTIKSAVENQHHSNLSYSPEEEYIAFEKALIIEMIIEKMPVQRKKIYQLRQQGLTNEEISTELKTTKRNVESQMSMALKEIRNTLKYNFIFFL